MRNVSLVCETSGVTGSVHGRIPQYLRVLMKDSVNGLAITWFEYKGCGNCGHLEKQCFFITARWQEQFGIYLYTLLSNWYTN